MTVIPLLAVGIIMKIATVLFVICSVILIFIILLQKGRGGGLSAALGGAMASGLLGSKTGDFLTWVTIVLVSIFLSLAVAMAKFYRPTVPDVGPGETPPQMQPTDTGQPPLLDVNQDSTSDVNDRSDA